MKPKQPHTLNTHILLQIEGWQKVLGLETLTSDCKGLVVPGTIQL